MLSFGCDIVGTIRPATVLRVGRGPHAHGVRPTSRRVSADRRRVGPAPTKAVARREGSRTELPASVEAATATVERHINTTIHKQHHNDSVARIAGGEMTHARCILTVE